MAACCGSAAAGYRPPSPSACSHNPLTSYPSNQTIPTDDIRERVKALGFERHKLAVHVLCGEKKQQAFSSCSRCLWDTATDGFASGTFQSETLFCSAQVFALYFE